MNGQEQKDADLLTKKRRGELRSRGGEKEESRKEERVREEREEKKAISQASFPGGV